MRLYFDHGTIVFVEPDADLLAELSVPYEPLAAVFRVPAHRYAELKSELERRGRSFVDEVDRAMSAPLVQARLDPLRQYQREALHAWRRAGLQGQIVLPTGSGKTLVALAAIASLQVSTLCLVPTRTLLRQWRSAIERALPVRVACWGDGFAEIGPITVCTYHSAARHMDRLGGRFKLLIVDEVHHFGAEQRAATLRASAAPFRLGLTATPCDGNAQRRIDALLGPIVHRIEIADLTGSYLSPFDVAILCLPLTGEERAACREYDNTFRSYRQQHAQLFPANDSWQQFFTEARRCPEGRAALQAFRARRKLLALTVAKLRAIEALLERHHQRRVLIFTADNQTCYAISKRFLIMPITCDIGRSEREQALADFRAGHLRALVSSRVLNEGVDVPEADVAIVVGGQFGKREYVQRIGRLLRPAPGKRALVYELVTSGTAELTRARLRRRELAPRVTTTV